MRRHILLLTVIALAFSLFIAGCPKKTPPPPPPPPVETPPEPQVEEPVVEPEPEPEPELRTVYFNFDRYNIREDQRARLMDNAEELRKFPGVNVLIEGHCDERGTSEYNMALGQKRAKSVKDFMTNYGIAATRITTKSYGEEQPVCTQSTEECWQRNRRAEFIIRE